MGQLRQLQGRNESRVRRDQRVSIMGSPFPLPAHNHNAEYHGSSRLRACSVTISEMRGETPAQQSVAMKVSLLLIRLLSDHPSIHPPSPSHDRGFLARVRESLGFVVIFRRQGFHVQHRRCSHSPSLFEPCLTYLIATGTNI
jgi:hypothetical protein